MRGTLLMMCLTFLLVGLPARAQNGPPKVTPSTREAFDLLASQADVGSLFWRAIADGRRPAETLIEAQGLIATYRTPTNLGWGGNWEHEDPVGRVSIHVGAPDIIGGSDSAWVMFEPRNEEPIPQALLAHLLTIAATTTISGADSLTLSFGYKTNPIAKGCTSETTLTIRLGTGAMLAHTQRTRCDVPAK